MHRPAIVLFLLLSFCLILVPAGNGQLPPVDLYELPAVPAQVLALNDALIPAPLSPDSASPALLAKAMPARQEVPATVKEDSQILDMRASVQKLGVQRNHFVHCELRGGKILTGTIVRIEPQAFYVQTNAVGNPYKVSYADLVSAPRPVPAVGTRLKQGLQWTGLGIVLAVGIPLLVVLSPILYFTGAWDC
jgi:hypothetical protein